MDVIIREIENKDYISVATLWRDVLGLLSVTDEDAVKTYEKMKDDNRYCTFVADVSGSIVGLVTTVETLAINYPNGYIKVNGLAVLPESQHRGIGKLLMERVEKLASEIFHLLDLPQAFSEQMPMNFMNIWVIKNYRFGFEKKYKVWYKKIFAENGYFLSR